MKPKKKQQQENTQKMETIRTNKQQILYLMKNIYREQQQQKQKINKITKKKHQK